MTPWFYFLAGAAVTVLGQMTHSLVIFAWGIGWILVSGAILIFSKEE
jgi:hypothetical protein